MNHRQKIDYIGLGGLLVIIGMIIVYFLMPNPDEIRCCALRIVNSDGEVMISLEVDEQGGVIEVKNSTGESVITLDAHSDIPTLEPLPAFPRLPTN